MRGYITKVDSKRGDTYRLFVSDGRDERGKRRRVTRRVRGTKSEAERQLRALIHEVETGTYFKPTGFTVAEFLVDQWLPVHKLAVRPTTFYTSRAYIDLYINPRIGGLALSDLRREHIQDLQSSLLSSGGRDGGPLSPGTVRKIRQILRGALSSAVKWEIIPRNVVELVDPPALERKTVRVLELREINDLLEKLEPSSPWAVAPTVLAFHTGLRRSEILGITWSALDLTWGELSVRQGYHVLDDGTHDIRPPKSRRGARLVTLTATSLALLRDHRRRCELDAELLGRQIQQGDFVFAGIDGVPFRPDGLSKAFRRAALRAGLTGVSFRTARHTHASLLLAAGVHPKVVSERLGHASVAFTLDTYSHVMPGIQEAAAESLDRMFKTGRGAARPASGVLFPGS